MALDASNSSNLEQLALKGFSIVASRLTFEILLSKSIPVTGSLVQFRAYADHWRWWWGCCRSHVLTRSSLHDVTGAVVKTGTSLSSVSRRVCRRYGLQSVATDASRRELEDQLQVT